MTDIDLIVETAAMHGQLSTGVPAAIVASRSSLGKRGVAILAVKSSSISKSVRSPRWSNKEDKFLKTYLGILKEEDIAEILGRSLIAVRLRWSRDLGLPSPSKHPDFITCNQIAIGLCIDTHTAMHLIDRGILDGHLLPANGRQIRLVNRVTLLRFIVNPMNWIYFKPERVGRPSPMLMRRMGQIYDAEFWSSAGRLARKRQLLWTDEWWRIGKVARYHKVVSNLVSNLIRKGRLKATDWGNYWVLKSHATDTSLRFWPGSGRKGEDKLHISPHAEAFMVLAEALGLMHSEIAGLMKWKEKRVCYLLRKFHLEKRIQKIIKENNLKIFYNKKTGKTFASWKVHKKRFPFLVRFMKSLKDNNQIFTRSEKKHINIIKHKTEKFEQCYQKST